MNTPRRYGLEHELAEAIFARCSERVSNITGQTLAVRRRIPGRRHWHADAARGRDINTSGGSATVRKALDKARRGFELA